MFYFNARSLLPKIDEVHALCANEHYDLVVVVETWLSAEGYNLVHKDRNRHGGGIAIYIRAHVNVNTLQLPHPDLKHFYLSPTLIPTYTLSVGSIVHLTLALTICQNSIVQLHFFVLRIFPTLSSAAILIWTGQPLLLDYISH